MPLHLRPNPTSPLPPFTFAPPSPPPASPSQNDPTIDVEPRKYLPCPPADFIPERDMHMFGTYPLKGEAEAGRGLVRCRRCGKVVMEWALGAHRRICAHVLDGTPLVHKKSIKVGKDEGGKKRRASEVSESESASPHKKRPKLPSNEHLDPHLYKGLKKSEIKKLQKERMRVEKREAKEREKFEVAERKRQRASNPINYDRQCGVINDKNLPCSRSLTCKTHTVGAKRAVEGRSRSYDMLYLEWQRLNNPNFKGPAGKKDVRPGMAGMGRKEKKVVIKWEGDEDGGVGDEGALEELVQLARVAGEKLARPGRGGGGGGVQKGFVLEGGGGGGVWRAASYEFSMVGDMLTKALAARPRAQPMGGAKGGGMGTAGKGMGLGMNLGTGMGMGMGIGMGSGMGTVPMMAGGGFGEGFPAGMYSVTA